MSRASVKFFCVTLNSIRTVILEIKRDNSLYNAMAAALTYSLNNLKLAIGLVYPFSLDVPLETSIHG